MIEITSGNDLTEKDHEIAQRLVDDVMESSSEFIRKNLPTIKTRLTLCHSKSEYAPNFNRLTFDAYGNKYEMTIDIINPKRRMLSLSVIYIGKE